MADNETITDIIAEKRRNADRIERDCAEKMKRGEMISDCYARELVADIRQEADRLEATWKRDTKELRVEIERLKEERNYSGVRERERLRAKGFAIVPKEQLERGNAAKLREALRECAQYIACVAGVGVGAITINDEVRLIPEELTQKAITALAATEKEGGAK